MSNSSYNTLWHETQKELSQIISEEPNPETQKPEKDRNAAFQQLATLYIKYIQIFRNIERCYDQILHPQKRRLLLRLLNCVIGRFLEIKKELVKLELSEFHYFDDILADMKLTPNDVEIPIPKYYVYDSFRVLKDREHFLDQLLSTVSPDTKKDLALAMTSDEAIRMIQRHERARQGRLRAKFMREIRQQEEAEKTAGEKKRMLDPDDAATLLQKLWRGVLARRAVRKMRSEEIVWLGMTPSSANHLIYKSNMVKLAYRIDAVRRVTQGIYEQEYQDALVKIKEKVRESEGADMRENMQDQIRQWFVECRDATGKFPDYPEEDEGGSAAIFKEKTPEEIAQELKAKEEAALAEKNKKAKGKPEKPPPKEEKKKQEEEPQGWRMAPSLFLKDLAEGCQQFTNVWANHDETNNFEQHHDEEMIKDEKRAEVEAEVRIQVDELLRQELRNLKIAIDKEKVKRVARKKPKRGKGKKGKKGKGRKEKDLTADRTLLSLYEELVLEGIIKKPHKTMITDYRGGYAYLGTTLRQANIEPQPSLSDVRRTVTEYAVLPLGSAEVHSKAPWIKSILLAGPVGTGKRTLVDAVCTETGANLFDLSADNILGKYPGREGLKMMMHMIFKVARLLQPSVLMVNNCEKMFKKKIPKTDLSDPKRLKKELPRSMKLLKPEDRVILIGCTSAPFEAEVRPFCNLYEKILLIPRPDYNTLHLLWRAMILKLGGILTPAMDISSMAKVSDGYTAGNIFHACKHVLTDRRLATIGRRPLQASEFIAPLANSNPVFAEEEEAYKTWYRKTPLGKMRALAIQMEAEEEAANAAAKKGNAGKKKKK